LNAASRASSLGLGILGTIAKNAFSISRPAGSFEPVLRKITPPGGVFVSAPIPTFANPAELSTQPCNETCSTITGLSGKTPSRSSRVRLRRSASVAGS
jgi:hypothetical protein